MNLQNSLFNQFFTESIDSCPHVDETIFVCILIIRILFTLDEIIDKELCLSWLFIKQTWHYYRYYSLAGVPKENGIITLWKIFSVNTNFLGLLVHTEVHFCSFRQHYVTCQGNKINIQLMWDGMLKLRSVLKWGMMVLLSSCRIYKRILSSKLVSKNGQYDTHSIYDSLWSKNQSIFYLGCFKSRIYYIKFCNWIYKSQI